MMRSDSSSLAEGTRFFRVASILFFYHPSIFGIAYHPGDGDQLRHEQSRNDGETFEFFIARVSRNVRTPLDVRRLCPFFTHEASWVGVPVASSTGAFLKSEMVCANARRVFRWCA